MSTLATVDPPAEKTQWYADIQKQREDCSPPSDEEVEAARLGSEDA